MTTHRERKGHFLVAQLQKRVAERERENMAKIYIRHYKTVHVASFAIKHLL